MIKNIILDVGGILFDDSKDNIEKILGKDCDYIYKTAYGKEFQKCLLGKLSIQEYINSFQNEKDFNDIKYILEKDNLKKSYPLIENNFEFIKKLKKDGYKLFLLTNITEDSYNYINSIININDMFDGGIYSYQEHLIKPSYEIYNLVLNRFSLNKEETLFFDDKEKNVIVANELGIKSFIFTSIIDIKNNIRYAAPNIIVLDILDGLYFPPKEFIDAVMDCPEYASEEYKDFIRAYTEHNFWGENKQVIENIETACLLIQQDHNYFKEFVLENKAINIVTKKGSLLNYAIQLKDNEIAEWLIEEKIDINSFDGLELLTALKMNNTRIALQLLRHGIITDGDEMKSNPLLFAIKIGSRELVEELMTKHRHLVAVYTNEYVKNYTILDIAKRYKNDQIIQTVKKYL